MKRSNRFTLYIVLLALTVLTMVCIRLFIHSKQLGPHDLAKIEQEGVLRIGMEYNKGSYYVSGDSIAGFEYELSKALEKRSGLKVEIYPEANLNKCIEALQQQRIDVIARPMPITLQYKESFNFTNPIFTNRLVLVQRKADVNNNVQPIRNQLELGGKKVYIPANSASRQRLENLMVEIADTIYIEEDPLYGEEQLIMLVARNQIDYAICSENMARTLIKDYPNLDILTAVGFNQFRGWALRKDSPVLLDSLNVWLHDVLDSTEFAKKKDLYLKPRKK